MGGKTAVTSSSGIKGVNQHPHPPLLTRHETGRVPFHSKASYIRLK